MNLFAKKSSPPTLISIHHNDYEAKYIGHTADGRQFFVTSPFIAAKGDSPGCEFLAVFLFDKTGRFLEARIDDLGPRAELDENYARELQEKRREELKPFEYGNIKVQPFQIERFGTAFGLIPEKHDDDDWWVELHPANYMAFHEPWDSGEYDT